MSQMMEVDNEHVKIDSHLSFMESSQSRSMPLDLELSEEAGQQNMDVHEMEEEETAHLDQCIRDQKENSVIDNESKQNLANVLVSEVKKAEAESDTVKSDSKVVISGYSGDCSENHELNSVSNHVDGVHDSNEIAVISDDRSRVKNFHTVAEQSVECQVNNNEIAIVSVINEEHQLIHKSINIHKEDISESASEKEGTKSIDLDNDLELCASTMNRNVHVIASVATDAMLAASAKSGSEHQLEEPKGVFKLEATADSILKIELNEAGKQDHKSSLTNKDTEDEESDRDDIQSESESEDDDDDERELMGFHFNKDRKLVDANYEPFQFHKHSVHWRNQKRYEKLGKKLTEYVYGLLETKCNLERVYVPVDASEKEPRSFIFVSKEAFTTEDKLLVLIHGSGVVRAGQWARSLIINHSLDSGTQIPFIDRAMKEGYEVLVLNTNLNSVTDTSQLRTMIPGSEDPESHAIYVWENLIEKAKAKHIAIIAHSYGGVVTTDLMRHNMEFFKRVFAVAFTDSVHSLNIAYDSPEIMEFYRENARNWVTSTLPLDEPIKSETLQYLNDAPRFSAGHTKHEWTSWSSFDAIFNFLSRKYVAVSTNRPNSNL